MGKMLLRLVRRLLALVPAALLLVLLGMLVLPLTEGADTAPVPGSADWMAALPDDTPLSALVIPGTPTSPSVRRCRSANSSRRASAIWTSAWATRTRAASRC